MKYSDELLGSAGVEDTTYKIDKYFRRIETIEMNLSERGSCAPTTTISIAGLFSFYL